MKIVRVQYTTRAEYAATNIQNIRAVAAAVKELRHPGIKYSTYLLEDGKTFMHFDQFENEAAHQLLQELEAFKKFAAELWASNLEVEPVLELPGLVASTEDFFGTSTTH
jgi:hypothetical protein